MFWTIRCEEWMHFITINKNVHKALILKSGRLVEYYPRTNKDVYSEMLYLSKSRSLSLLSLCKRYEEIFACPISGPRFQTEICNVVRFI